MQRNVKLTSVKLGTQMKNVEEKIVSLMGYFNSFGD